MVASPCLRPLNVNLARCDLCSSPAPTVRHILNYCPVSLDQGGLTWRHDSVLNQLVTTVISTSRMKLSILTFLGGWLVSLPQLLSHLTSLPLVIGQTSSSFPRGNLHPGVDCMPQWKVKYASSKTEEGKTKKGGEVCLSNSRSRAQGSRSHFVTQRLDHSATTPRVQSETFKYSTQTFLLKLSRNYCFRQQKHTSAVVELSSMLDSPSIFNARFTRHLQCLIHPASSMLDSPGIFNA